MGARDVSLQELQGLLGDGFSSGSVLSGRVAQEDTTKFMLIQKPTGTKPPPPATEVIQKKGLIGASEGFDITEHLDEVMWSSDSDTEVTTSFDGGGSSKSSPKTQSQKSDVDGHLKPNQYPLSQLLASTRTVDEIAAVLGEGIDDVKKEVSGQNVSMEVDLHNVVATNIVPLKEENEVKKEVSPENLTSTDIELSHFGSKKKVPLDDGTKVVDRLLIKSTLSDEKNGQGSCSGSDLEVVEELNRSSTRNDLIDILEVLDEEETECKPDQEIAEDKKSDAEILTSMRTESLSLDFARRPTNPVPELNSAIDENLLEKGFAEQKPVVMSEKCEATGNTERTNHIELEPKPIQKKDEENGDIHTKVAISDQKIIDYLEDVVKVPPTSFSVCRVETIIDNPGEKNDESEINKASTSQEVQNEVIRDSTSTDSEDDLIPVEDSPPKYPSSSEKLEASESEAEEAGEEPERIEFAKMSDSELKGMQASLESERDQLMSEQGRQERMAQTVTDQMYADAQVCA